MSFRYPVYWDKARVEKLRADVVYMRDYTTPMIAHKEHAVLDNVATILYYILNPVTEPDDTSDGPVGMDEAATE